MVNIRTRRGELQQYRELILLMMNIEKRFAKPLEKIYKKRYMDASSAAASGNITDAGNKMLKYSGELKAIFKTYYKTVMLVFGKKLFQDVKPGKDYFLIGFEYKGMMESSFIKNMMQWAETQATKKVKLISLNQKAKVAKIIERGLENNLSHTIIAKEIESKTAYSMFEALRTARTETHTCAVQSTQAATKAVPDLEFTKYWLSANDERTRETHFQASIDYGKENAIGMDDTYEVGSSSLLYPGDPEGEAEDVVNCRCVELYNTVEKPSEEEGQS